MAAAAILAEWRALVVRFDAPAAVAVVDAVAEDGQGHVENQIRLGLSVTVWGE